MCKVCAFCGLSTLSKVSSQTALGNFTKFGATSMSSWSKVGGDKCTDIHTFVVLKKLDDEVMLCCGEEEVNLATENEIF